MLQQILIFDIFLYSFLFLILQLLYYLREKISIYGAFMFAIENSENITITEKCIYNWLGGCGFCFCGFWTLFLFPFSVFFINFEPLQFILLLMFSAGVNSQLYFHSTKEI